MAKYAAPGTEGSAVTFAPRYDNFIGGEWVAPADGQYFENASPIDGKVFTRVARGTAPDIEKALDAAHAAAEAWVTPRPLNGRTPCCGSPTGWNSTSRGSRSPKPGITASRFGKA